ncbi:MAG: rhodanese-like domain-containing protein [Phycisphaerae bacterium]
MSQEISAGAVQEKLRRPEEDLVLLDCREPDELQLAHIEGAVNIPVGDIPSRLQSLDPEKEYVVFCHHGMRSLNVVEFLRKQDFGRVASMAGGIDAWSLEVDQTVPRY